MAHEDREDFPPDEPTSSGSGGSDSYRRPARDIPNRSSADTPSDRPGADRPASPATPLDSANPDNE